MKKKKLIKYNSFLEKLDNEITTNKKQILSDLESNAESYLNDIEKKNQERRNKKDLIIQQIIDLKSNDNEFSETDLKYKDISELKEILIKLKKEKKPLIIKIINFLAGID
jgi:hypothetical protein